MYNYLIIESLSAKKNDWEIITNMIDNYVSVDSKHFSNNVLYIQGVITDIILLEETINAINTDFVYDIKSFISKDFSNTSELEANYLLVNTLLKRIPNTDRQLILNTRDLAKLALKYFDKETVLKFILGKYYLDSQIKKTVIIFLELDQNVSKTAKALFIHRNTLIQKIDKFNYQTGLDIKKFIDAAFIYSILK